MDLVGSLTGWNVYYHGSLVLTEVLVRLTSKNHYFCFHFNNT